MEQNKKSYNLVIGVVALLAIILMIAIIGYFVSRPKPLVSRVRPRLQNTGYQERFREESRHFS